MEYFSYLLRIWSEMDFNHISWRLSLEKPGTGEMINFHDLDAFVDFLAHKMTEEPQGLPGVDRSNPDE